MSYAPNQFPKTCSNCFATITEAEWATLPLKGFQAVDADPTDPSDPDAYTLEMRDHDCGTTLSVRKAGGLNMDTKRIDFFRRHPTLARRLLAYSERKHASVPAGMAYGKLVEMELEVEEALGSGKTRLTEAQHTVLRALYAGERVLNVLGLDGLELVEHDRRWTLTPRGLSVILDGLDEV